MNSRRQHWLLRLAWPRSVSTDGSISGTGKVTAFNPMHTDTAISMEANPEAILEAVWDASPLWDRAGKGLRRRQSIPGPPASLPLPWKRGTDDGEGMVQAGQPEDLLCSEEVSGAASVGGRREWPVTGGGDFSLVNAHLATAASLGLTVLYWLEKQRGKIFFRGDT